jgi:hypothetical protein
MDIVSPLYGWGLHGFPATLHMSGWSLKRMVCGGKGVIRKKKLCYTFYEVMHGQYMKTMEWNEPAPQELE